LPCPLELLRTTATWAKVQPTPARTLNDVRGDYKNSERSAFAKAEDDEFKDDEKIERSAVETREDNDFAHGVSNCESFGYDSTILPCTEISFRFEFPSHVRALGTTDYAVGLMTEDHEFGDDEKSERPAAGNADDDEFRLASSIALYNLEPTIYLPSYWEKTAVNSISVFALSTPSPFPIFFSPCFILPGKNINIKISRSVSAAGVVHYAIP
jgi:hypothetical protein